MSKLKILSTKICKIVMGVILFLCTSMVLNTEVYAISNEFVSKNFGYNASLKVKSVGGVCALFGYNSNNEVMKYECGSKTIYANDYNLTNKDSSSKKAQYGTVTGTFDFDSFGKNASLGVHKCKYSVYVSWECWAGSSGWNREDALDFTVYNFKITIKSNIGNKLKFVGNKWNSSTKHYVDYTNNVHATLPVESDLEVDGNYRFKGFSSNSSCTGPLLPYGDKVVLSTSVTSRTYWACFEEVEASNSFTFSIDGNGGTINGNSTYTITCNSSSCKLFDFIIIYKKDNYKISGFSTKADCSGKLFEQDVVVTKSDSQWYACWDKIDNSTGFTITINGNGGTINGNSTYTNTCNSSSCKLYDFYKSLTFKRDNYKINGFSTKADCSGKLFEQDVVFTNSEKTWYACWDKIDNSTGFTITINGNGGTINGKSAYTKTCNSSSCKLYDFYNTLTFKKDNYIVNGFSKKADCSGKLFEQDVVFTSSEKTWHACWDKIVTTTTTKPSTPNVKTFNVIFDGNGGKNADGKSSISFTCQDSCSYFPGVDTFSNGNKIHLGWDTSNNCNNPGYVTSAVTSGVTYYSCWKEQDSTNPSTPTLKQYTVAFNQSWGTNLVCSELGYSGTTGECTKTYVEGDKITLPTTNAYNSYNNNYKFMFWTPEFTNNDTVCTDSIKALYSSGKSYTVNSNVTFAACYRETFKDSSRWAMEGASADGNVIPCGSELRITECIIESDGNEYCFYDKVGNKSQSGKIYRNKMVSNPAGAICNEEVKDIGYKYGTISSIIDVSFECGAKLYITTCNGNICNFTSYQNPNGSVVSVNGTVNKDYLKDSQNAALNDTNYCPKSEEIKKCSNDISKNVKSSITKKVCYDKGYDDSQVKSLIIEKNLVLCGAGYVLDKTAIRAVGDENCNSKYCERNFTVECKPSDKRGIISLRTTTVDVGSDGYGTVTVNATSSNSTIVGYYLSELYKAPTLKSDWISVSSGNFTVRSTPGNKYIWVKDSNGTISNVATVAVRDSVNLNTTLKVLELKDGNNSNMILSYLKENTSDGYTLLSSGNKSDTLIAQGFNSQVHEYRVNVESSTLTVYATLTSSDSSYVDGYGPRTVNLTYGANTILIKIRNNEGKIRTYTIIANRTDDRSADNTLNNILLSVGDIDFNSNKTEYIIKIPASTKAVNIEAQRSSSLSKFVNGYGPGAIAITGDTTVKLIKVESQTGSVRTYVLTFVREKSDIISKESLQLSGITIPGVNVPFESNVSNYNITVDYETDVIDLYSYLKHPNSMSIVSIKKSANAEYVPTSNLGISLDEGINYIEIKVINAYGEEAYYRLTIIRKEYGLGISDDTSLKDLNVLGYNIDFNPNKKEYNVKIKTEKSLVITAVPESNRAEVFIRGNEELTGFSTVRIKVVAENGEYETYSIDIRKDPFNKTIEIASIVVGSVIIFVTGCIIIMKKKYKNKKDYYKE